MNRQLRLELWELHKDIDRYRAEAGADLAALRRELEADSALHGAAFRRKTDAALAELHRRSEAQLTSTAQGVLDMLRTAMCETIVIEVERAVNDVVPRLVE
jgi:F0F1-type ATP synthase membrane subunit b/b'